ncbi:hypothetical protein RRG08_051929 [Elysia crispata]|uniref:Uncharacterized protein n=1 Tax=Elysia crispata TaxID=231223 RepID=A0AAE1CRB5_9GAST|nr:hypothetical protein RRG08_051929 [Elysia crispata]
MKTLSKSKTWRTVEKFRQNKWLPTVHEGCWTPGPVGQVKLVSTKTLNSGFRLISRSVGFVSHKPTGPEPISSGVNLILGSYLPLAISRRGQSGADNPSRQAALHSSQIGFWSGREEVAVIKQEGDNLEKNVSSQKTSETSGSMDIVESNNRKRAAAKLSPGNTSGSSKVMSVKLILVQTCSQA